MSEYLQKRCKKCGETKSLEAFAKRSDGADGRRTECKLCGAKAERIRYAANPDEERERKRAYREDNAEKISERERARWAADPEKFRTQHRAWKTANPEKVSVQNRKYRQNNLEKVKAIQQAWYVANLDKVSQQQSIYRRDNPNVIRAKGHRRRTRLKNNGGSCTGVQLTALHIAQNHQCAYCQRRVTLTIDHIFPVKRGGGSDISNISWACRPCNLNKGAKTLEEWTNRWYYAQNDNSA